MIERFSKSLETSTGTMVTVIELPEHPEKGDSIMIMAVNWENGEERAKSSVVFGKEAAILLIFSVNPKGLSSNHWRNDIKLLLSLNSNH